MTLMFRPRCAALTMLAALTFLGACAERPEPAPIVFRGSQPSTPAPAVAAPPAPVSVQSLPGPSELTPSASGVVDYGGYSAIVAGPNDSLEAMASRVGLSASALASYNGLPAGWRPEAGDELILPPREGGYASVAPSPTPAPAATPAPQPVETAAVAPAAGGGLDLDRIAATLATPAPAVAEPAAAPSATPVPSPQPAARVATATPTSSPGAAPTASGRFIRPVQGEVLRGFSRASGPSRNNGIDFAAEPGAAVVAAADGRVALITQPVGVDGAIVMVDHGDDLLAIYGRLEDIAVQKDQTVRRGDVLGRVAPAQAAERPFLQFEMIKGTESVDPADYLG